MAKQRKKAPKKTSTPKIAKPSFRQLYLSRVLIGLAVLFFLTYIASTFFTGKKSGTSNSISSSSNSSSSSNNSTANITFRKDGDLEFVTESGNKKIDVEIVDQEANILQGLMYRRSMAENQGMLFKFPDMRPRSFWMKNTYIPLDIIYVDSDKKIVSIQKNTEPLNASSLPSEGDAQYVVEVNAGFCDAYGIKKGDQINF